MKHYLQNLEKVRILSFSGPPFVDAAVPAAFVAAEADAVDAAETDAAAASENEFGAVETVVQLKECAQHDCWDRVVGLLQKK